MNKPNELTPSEVHEIVNGSIDITKGIVEATLFATGATSEEKKVSAEELCTVIGLSDIRTLRKLIAEERRNGAPIVTASHGGGHWVCDAETPEGREAIAKSSKTMIRKGVQTIITGRKLRRLIRNPKGQMQIGEDSEA